MPILRALELFFQKQSYAPLLESCDNYWKFYENESNKLFLLLTYNKLTLTKLF